MRAFLSSLTILVVIASLPCFGQVGLNTTTPDPSSVLDLTATDKGVLIPRMTSAQRQAIATPATSLLVFDTTEGAFYYYNGSQWNTLEAWDQISGAVTYNGRVGVNTASPDGSSVLDLNSSDKGILIPRMTSAQRQAVASPAAGLLVFDTTENRFYFFQGTQWYAVNPWDRPAGSNTITYTGDVTINGTLSATGFGGINVSGTVPAGGIIMWSGSVGSIPTGWALCDGTNGTPDLRERFIVGAGGDNPAVAAGLSPVTGPYNPGDVGGANSASLTTTQIPNHTHTMASGGSHSHTLENFSRRGYPDGSNDRTTNYYFIDASRDPINAGSSLSMSTTGSHTHTINSSGGGGTTGQPHESRPPFYALAFIMKL